MYVMLAAFSSQKAMGREREGKPGDKGWASTQDQ